MGGDELVSGKDGNDLICTGEVTIERAAMMGPTR